MRLAVLCGIRRAYVILEIVMDSGFYAACTALMARTQALDLVANNLANSSTPGYRGQHDIFRSLLTAASRHVPDGLNEAINSYGVLGGTRLDLSQGNLEHTGNELDFAIEGSGFFMVQSGTEKFFTRNGNFRVSPQGQLVTAEGDPVLGESGPIRIVGGPVTVSEDGTISIQGAVAGKIKVVSLTQGTQLESNGRTYYTAPENSIVADSQSKISQGMLEASNINPVTSAVDLVSVQRYAEMMQRALSMFHSELNRIATDELPRVTP